MLVLAIESSSQVAGAALVDEDRVLAECTLNRGLTHSEALMTLIDSTLKMARVEVSDIDLFAASRGPGSFTGLRIGIATVKGLAQALDRPVVGVPTLDGLAYNIQYTDRIICPIMDARRKQVYTSIYEYMDGKLSRADEYMAIPLENLIDRLLVDGRQVVFVGDGIRVYREVIEGRMKEKALFPPIPFREQRASSIASIAMDMATRGETSDFKTLTPFYLRKSQAEQRRDVQKTSTR